MIERVKGFWQDVKNEIVVAIRFWTEKFEDYVDRTNNKG